MGTSSDQQVAEAITHCVQMVWQCQKGNMSYSVLVNVLCELEHQRDCASHAFACITSFMHSLSKACLWHLASCVGRWKSGSSYIYGSNSGSAVIHTKHRSTSRLTALVARALTSCRPFGISPEWWLNIAGRAEGRAEWGSSPAAGITYYTS